MESNNAWRFLSKGMCARVTMTAKLPYFAQEPPKRVFCSARKLTLWTRVRRHSMAGSARAAPLTLKTSVPWLQGSDIIRRIWRHLLHAAQTGPWDVRSSISKVILFLIKEICWYQTTRERSIFASALTILHKMLPIAIHMGTGHGKISGHFIAPRYLPSSAHAIIWSEWTQLHGWTADRQSSKKTRHSLPESIQGWLSSTSIKAKPILHAWQRQPPL